MATKDTNSGLLSKMARFVRNPTKDWSDLDKPEPEQESGYSKLALKEMIERKRQNDFVRRREFDQLRKLRRNGPAVAHEPTGRPSFFQSSTASNLDERAMTLKKIDEIEAQMSKQWWKGKQGEAPVGTTPAAAAGSTISGSRDSVTSTSKVLDGHFAPTQMSEMSGDESVQRSDYPTTQMGFYEPDPSLPTGGVEVSPVTKVTKGKTFDASVSGFSTSRFFSSELGGGLNDPDMEEAAIRFANGDDAGAEAGLLAALQADLVHQDSAERWAAALFDLYRSTGQQASFDRIAIDYAQRFGRSAPAWFSTPDLLGRRVAAFSSVLVKPSMPRGHAVWASPPALDLPAVVALRGCLSSAVEPWRMDWRELAAIAPDAGKALADLVAAWCLKPVKLTFTGADVLDKLLRQYTPQGEKQVDLFWWQLRLDVFRILRMQDEFELAALDYCVTYEVSPPPWQDARCDYVREHDTLVLSLAPGDGLADEARPSPLDALDQPANFDFGSSMLPAAEVELMGDVLGDAVEVLDRLQAGLQGADRLVISCARLIRVDFSAAGSILNWVAVRESEGCQVQFREVSRLVAAFFNVIGINEHARVVLRTT